MENFRRFATYIAIMFALAVFALLVGGCASGDASNAFKVSRGVMRSVCTAFGNVDAVIPDAAVGEVVTSSTSLKEDSENGEEIEIQIRARKDSGNSK